MGVSSHIVALAMCLLIAIVGCDQKPEISDEELERQAEKLRPLDGEVITLIRRADGKGLGGEYHVGTDCPKMLGDMNRMYGIKQHRLNEKVELQVKNGRLVDGKGAFYDLKATPCDTCIE